MGGRRGFENRWIVWATVIVGAGLALAAQTPGTIETIAGGGAADGGTATSAMVNLPIGVAVDGAGNLFIADSNNRVRKVATDGTITTVAGTGVRGFSGDGGPATGAMLASPSG